jgi:hypothetical protein
MRIVAAKVLLDRGWGKPKEMHQSEVDDNKTLLKVVNEIVHVYETREQIEFRDQTPLRVEKSALKATTSSSSAPRPSSSRYWRRRATSPIVFRCVSVIHRDGRRIRINLFKRDR